MESFDLTKTLSPKRLELFASYLMELSDRYGMKISSRGWAYALEGERIINKDQFNKVEAAINRCRRRGLIPIDFVAEDEGRMFKNVLTPNEKDPEGYTMPETVDWMLKDVLYGAKHYEPDWWANEDYYIQVVVEKIDLMTLFLPVCKQYKIPIATSKGWASMLQRAQYARRYQQAEADGLECVLLYCGDHDPDGLRISEFLRKNILDLRDIEWEDGTPGYDPANLTIERFGLNYDFIEQHGFTWIDNLITGSGKDLASRNHKNHKYPYVRKYIKDIGKRKCEANAIITKPAVARGLMHEAIENFLGEDSQQRFERKKAANERAYAKVLKASGLDLALVKKARAKVQKMK